jgi:mannitol/fructose-specific phosphotransferase system IIA component (Ntr-type)
VFEAVSERFDLPVVVLPESANTRDAVVRHLASVLIASGRIADGALDHAVAGILKREMFGSTAIGRGAAVPHVMTTAVSAPTGVVGHLAHGVDWGEPHAEPVTAVCLVLCPATCDRISDYLHMLEAAFRESATSSPK